MSLLSFNPDRPLDVIGLGRLCIDLNANEMNRPMEETRTFTKYVGGSPANITIALARLGAKTGFIGRGADDAHGRFIVRYLKENGINTDNVVTDRSGSVTGLAFTEIKSPTDCSILLYRDNVADLKLEPGDVREEYVASAKAIMISGTALAKSPSREAVFVALELARKHGVVTMFDVDYRIHPWLAKEEFAVYARLAAEKCDVLFGGREEFDLLEIHRGKSSDDADTAESFLKGQAKIVVIKRGKDGSTVYTRDGDIYHGRTFPAQMVKTFGAGDAFAGSFIYGLLQGWSIDKCQDYGAAAAAIVVSSHSCSDAMPTLAQVEEYVRKHTG